MSEHAWVLENIASHVTGGLELAEHERLERHVADCPPCARALAEARALDRSLDDLFTPVRPGATLEDRLIRSLRVAPPSRRLPFVRFLKVGLGAAAVLLVGVVGAAGSALLAQGGLPFPGGARATAGNTLSQVALGDLAFGAGLVAGREDSVQLWDAERGEHSWKRGHGHHSTTFSADGLAVIDNSRSMAEAGERLSERLQDGTSSTLIGKDANAQAVELREKHLSDLTRVPPQGATDEREVLGRNSRMLGALGYQAPALGLAVPGKSQAQNQVTDGRTATFSPADARSYSGFTPPASGSGGVAGATAAEGRPAADTPPAAGWGFVQGGKASGGFGGRSGATREQVVKEGGKPTDNPARTPPGPDAKTDGQDVYFSVANGPHELAVPLSGGDKASGRDRRGALYFKPSELLSQKAELGKLLAGAAPAGAPAAPAAAKPAARPELPRPGQEPPLTARETRPQPPLAQRKIIRSGDIEFEIESFDSAVAAVTKLIHGISGGFVATVNSEKLPNGKVRGSVVVRVPPEHLDGLVLDLHKELGKGGELKGQRIGSQDITKQYTDLESRLRAAKAMEERLLSIIKTGKGEIKDLVQAEKELGIWKTKIEEYEGEIRYYGNLVALSTLTVQLAEREIKAPSALVETERVNMGVEVEDVDRARQAVLTAVADVKGRVTKSEMKQHSAGQYSAVLHFEAAPDAAGPLRDRLKQLGNVARLEVDRLQQARGGSGPAAGAKVERSDAQFFVSLYNLVNVAPKETVHVTLAAADAADAYRQVLARAEKAAGRVLTSNLNQQRRDQTTGTVAFEVRAADADPMLLALKGLGEVLRLNVTENPAGENVTRSKRGFQVQLLALGGVQPRETADIKFAARDVAAAFRALQDAVTKAEGRVIVANLNEQDRQNVTAQLDLDFHRDDEADVRAALAAAGVVFSRTVARAPDSDAVSDNKVRWKVEMVNTDRIPPRETHQLAVEVADVEPTAAAFADAAAKAGGRSHEPSLSRERDGRVVSVQRFSVPLTMADQLVQRFKAAGTVRVEKAAKNEQVPEGDLAQARIDVTLSNVPLLVASDEGFWPRVRAGLSISLQALLVSLSWLIVGLCFVLPWGLLIYGGVRLVGRVWKRPEPAAPATV